jgi:hypothetical protein
MRRESWGVRFAKVSADEAGDTGKETACDYIQIYFLL